MSASECKIKVGNTYRRLSKNEAPLDRSGKFRKVHDVTVYVDAPSILEADFIEAVTFDFGPGFPQKYTCRSPVPAKSSAASRVFRFSSRQKLYGAVSVNIEVLCRGGEVRRYGHRLVLSGEGSTAANHKFRLAKNAPPLSPVGLQDNAQFGIELELSSVAHLSRDRILGKVHRGVASRHWKLVTDMSISCNRSQPNCNTFELVSPVLRGNEGLAQVFKVIQILDTFQDDIKVNKSMGFHVHIDVSGLTAAQLVKVCQNFVKYEDAMDHFFPPSRRSGSPESNRYFRSNRQSVSSSFFGGGATNKDIHQRLSRCRSISELAAIMNPNKSRYHKLNLQNLVTGRQPTLEFRQHSSTKNYQKISSWIRFCSYFVTNSARLAPPNPFSKTNSISKKQMDALFYYVIKDRALKTFYQSRMEQVKTMDEIDNANNVLFGFSGVTIACCDGCEHENTCQDQTSIVTPIIRNTLKRSPPPLYA